MKQEMTELEQQREQYENLKVWSPQLTWEQYLVELEEYGEGNNKQ